MEWRDHEEGKAGKLEAQRRKRFSLAFPLMHLSMVLQMGTHLNDFTKSTIIKEHCRTKEHSRGWGTVGIVVTSSR